MSPGLSSLDSNRICRPMQMPRKGFPERRYFRRGSIKPLESKARIACPKAPTPGKIRILASSKRLGSSLIITNSCPRRSKALVRLRTLPAPKATPSTRHHLAAETHHSRARGHALLRGVKSRIRTRVRIQVLCNVEWNEWSA